MASTADSGYLPLTLARGPQPGVSGTVSRHQSSTVNTAAPVLSPSTLRLLVVSAQLTVRRHCCAPRAPRRAPARKAWRGSGLSAAAPPGPVCQCDITQHQLLQAPLRCSWSEGRPEGCCETGWPGCWWRWWRDRPAPRWPSAPGAGTPPLQSSGPPVSVPSTSRSSSPSR